MHALWKGSISFGLVNIPVKMFSTGKENELKFVMLHKKDLSQIRYARICKTDGAEVPWNEIVKGFEYQPGEYVVLNQEDFDKANLKKTKSIEIFDFVKESEINSIYYVKPYILEPEKGASKTYVLLQEALIKSKKIGLAKYVVHNREHLAVIKPYKNMLILNQLRYEEELLKLNEVDIPAEKISPKEMAIALQLIDQQTAKFKPSDYRDTYHEEIKGIIEQKAKGRKIHPKGQAPQPTKVQDIMSLLKESLKQTPARKKRKPSFRETA